MILPLVANEPIVINEINYHSSDSFNPEDWIELYNVSDEIVDISGWEFRDNDDTHIFQIPHNSYLNSGEYLVLCKNMELFSNLFQDVENYIGDLGFGLSGAGELIRLYDSDGEIIDSLHYNDTYPWPVEPDGTGPTLELSNPYSDNSHAENWGVSDGNGTPGMPNSNLLSLENERIIQPSIQLLPSFPNPFNPVTTIQFSIPLHQNNNNKSVFNLSLEIYNISGEFIATLTSGNFTPGFYSVEWYAGNFPSGIYFASLNTGDFSLTEKLILLK